MGVSLILSSDGTEVRGKRKGEKKALHHKYPMNSRLDVRVTFGVFKNTYD